MESEARYAWVGAVIVGLVALLAAGLLWLQGGLGAHDFKRYAVYFREHSLSGLQLGSDVKMYGIKVGKVVDYAILPTGAKNVRVVIEVDGKTPVLEGAQAVVSQQLVTGLASIELSNVAENAAPLTRKPDGERYPVLTEGPPRFAKITANVEQLVERSNETLERLGDTLSEKNQAALGQTLANLETFSATLARRSPDIEQSLADLRDAAHQLQGLGRLAEQAAASLEDARSAARSMEREVHDTAAHLRLSTDLSLQDLQRTSRAVRSASDNVSDAAVAMQAPARAIARPAPGSLGPGE